MYMVVSFIFFPIDDGTAKHELSGPGFEALVTLGSLHCAQEKIREDGVVGVHQLLFPGLCQKLPSPINCLSLEVISETPHKAGAENVVPLLKADACMKPFGLSLVQKTKN